MRRAALLVLLLAAAGCGAERTPLADLDTPQEVTGRDRLDLPAAGLRLDLPQGWQRTQGASPLLASTSSGPVTIAVWRYPRAEPLPADDLALADARRSLIAAARARDRSLEVTSSQATTVADSPAVVIRGRGTIDGRRRVLRSVHVYAFGAEVVIDGFAPQRDLDVLDREHGAVVASLRVREP